MNPVRLNEPQLLAALDEIPFLLLATDADGIVTLAEGCGLAILGLDTEERVGRPIAEVLAGQDEITTGVHTALSGHDVCSQFIYLGFPLDACFTPMKGDDGAVVGAVVVGFDASARRRTATFARKGRALADSIQAAQAEIITGGDAAPIFDRLLGELLGLTESAYGFIGEVIHPAGEPPHLKTHAITDISWDEDSQRFYRENAHRGLIFRNLDTLFGQVISSGQPVIANDPRDGGLPPGHPPLAAFLGLPFSFGGELVGMVGIANRTGGYNESIIEFLQPLLVTCGAIIQAHRQRQSQRRAEQERDRVFTLSLDALAIGGLDGSFRRVNPAFERILGYTADEFRSRPFVEFAHPEDRPTIIAAVETLRAGQPVIQLELRSLCKDGSIKWLSWTAHPLVEEGVFYAVGRDVTEHRKTTEALRDADRRKDEFLAMLGHELRNPLAGIAHGLSLLSMSDAPARVVDRAHVVMQQQVRTLTQLIDDLLDVSRISRGKIRLHPGRMDLRRAVDHVAELIRPEIESQRHTLHIGLPATPIELDADPVRVDQILSNLLSNAAKYTEPGGTIWLDLEREGDEAVVRVRDTGIGIPAEMLSCIFDMFTQAPQSLDRSKGGLGIGLTLVRQLVQMLGGHIVAHSDGPGRGSEFVVRLPIAAEALDEVAGTVALGPESVIPLRLLVVDDNVPMVELLVPILELWGHTVVAVHDGPSALDAVETYHPDVVLCDIGLPGLDGYQVAKALQGLREPVAPVLIALSGYAQEEVQDRCRGYGFRHHLTKPVDLALLERLLASVRPRPVGLRDPVPFANASPPQ